jgi:hypothetical protein
MDKHRLRVLRQIFGPRKDKVNKAWRRLHSEGFYDMYCSPNIIWVIKSTRMRSVGHLAHMGQRKDHYRVLVGKPYGQRLREDLGIDTGMTLIWILETWNGVHGLDLPGSGQGQVLGTYECGNEPAHSKNEGNFLSS